MLGRRGFIVRIAALFGIGVVTVCARPTATEIIKVFPPLKDSDIYYHVDMDISWDDDKGMYKRLIRTHNHDKSQWGNSESYHNTFADACVITITGYHA